MEFFINDTTKRHQIQILSEYERPSVLWKCNLQTDIYIYRLAKMPNDSSKLLKLTFLYMPNYFLTQTLSMYLQMSDMYNLQTRFV